MGNLAGVKYKPETMTLASFPKCEDSHQSKHSLPRANNTIQQNEAQAADETLRLCV